MPHKSRFFAPGKLFLAGEYAILKPDGEAIILPAKKGIHVDVIARKTSRIINRQYPKESQRFKDISEVKNPYIRLGMEVVRQLLALKKRRWKNFTLTIDSELVAKQGKYGLGSSGALTVAIIGSLLQFFRIKFNETMLFQLAVIATIHNYQDTSFGDVACSSFRQPIHYRKFYPDFMPLIKTMSVQTLLKTPWQGLMIKPIHKSFTKPLVIYSGKSASSYSFVQKVLPFVTADWVKTSNTFIQEWLTHPSPISIEKLLSHLKKLAVMSHAPIFIPSIHQIIRIANRHEGIAKFSGAGGGDCVIAFIPQTKQAGFLRELKKERYKVLRDII
jgi:phosphomevalonate kinase